MSDLQVFQFPATGHAVRTVMVDGEPWFIGTDVSAVLGYSNGRVAIGRLPERMRGVTEVDTPGGRQSVTIVSEPGVYRLIMRSNLPAAEAFQDWVAEDVVPALRRTGRYEVARLGDALDEIEVARRWLAALEDKKAAEARAVEAEQRLAVAAPKVAYVDAFVDRDDATTIRVLAGQLGVGEQALRAYLVARGVLYRRLVGHRWSRSQRKQVPEYEWLAHSRYAPWFVAKDQPEAPRLHNGQVRTTLYVTPRGKAGVAAMIARRPIVGQDDLDVGESA